jgi:hypothetical protein
MRGRANIKLKPERKFVELVEISACTKGRKVKKKRAMAMVINPNWLRHAGRNV